MAYTTRKSLLLKVRSGDEISWGEFYRTYKPLIFAVCNCWNFSPEEKEELLQQVMLEIFNKQILAKYDIDRVPETFHYDPAKGRFRHYLCGIVRNHCRHFQRKRPQGETAFDESIQCEEDQSELDAQWDREWRYHLLAQGLEELKLRVEPETYQAFDLYGLRNQSVTETAKFLNTSVASVYTAKSRCLTLLRQIMTQLDEH